MSVYILRAGLDGPVKIGQSNKPRVRLQKLQAGHYETLYLVRIFDGGPAEELALRQRFAELHIAREWYGWCPSMMGDLGLVDIDVCQRQPRAAAEQPPLRPAARALLGTEAKVKATARAARPATIKAKRPKPEGRCAHGQRQKFIVELHDRGLSFEEIATEAGSTAASVRTTVYLARKIREMGAGA